MKQIIDMLPVFALATQKSHALNRCALHLHRVTGANIFSLLAPFLSSSQSKKRLDLAQIVQENQRKPFIRYVCIYDQNQNLIDSAVLSLFPGPKSYTGEDIIEISTHGNPLISAKLQSLFRSIGMRDAQPGEFTYRAVLNGKLDLAQAEGIDQVIHSETYGGIELAQHTVTGVLSRETQEIREHITSISAYLEAHIDFAPDEVGQYQPQSLLPELSHARERLHKLLSSYSSGLKAREGVKVVLTGKPNAGKSSLYNALLRYERAIVTDVPGTTRDTLEERLLINNRDFVLIDTAGLRKTEDTVEKLGVQRSFQSIAQADIICLLVDLERVEISNVNHFVESEVQHFLKEQNLREDQKLLVVISKKDLLNSEKISVINCDAVIPRLDRGNHIMISKNETHDLNIKLTELHDELTGKNTRENPTLISARQKDKVTLAIQFLDEAENLISLTEYPEKISSVINQAKHSLEEIVGEICLDNVYEKIFSTFCVGK